MSHLHAYQGKDWHFADPDDTAVFMCAHVFEGKTILHVVHDIEDGAWQFLCGDEGHKTEDARLLCFGCAVSRDSSLLALADLQVGWMADRAGPDHSWERSEHPGYDDEDDDVEDDNRG